MNEIRAELKEAVDEWLDIWRREESLQVILEDYGYHFSGKQFEVLVTKIKENLSFGDIEENELSGYLIERVQMNATENLQEEYGYNLYEMEESDMEWAYFYGKKEIVKELANIIIDELLPIAKESLVNNKIGELGKALNDWDADKDSLVNNQ